MRIGIDCRTILNPGFGESAGVGHYTYYLISNLLKIDRENKYFLFFDSLLSCEAAREIISGAKNAEIRFIPFYRYKCYLPLIFSHFLAAAVLKKEHLDVFHSPAYTLPLAYRGRSVVTVHDLAIYEHPEWFSGNKLAGKFFSTKFLVPKSLKKAARIIAVSEHTKKDIEKNFKIKSEKIDVVYEGTEALVPPGKEDSRCVATDNCFEDFRIRHGLWDRYVFFLGTIEPRKNISALIRAFSELVKNNKIPGGKLQLVLAGGSGWKNKKIFLEMEKAKKELGSENIIKYLGYIPARDKFSLIKHAVCFVFPSLYEGFGLPVIEAMSLGTPVITSNISSLPEIAGDAAILVDPLRPKEIASALERILSDKNLWEELSQRGIARAEKFSWEKCARETLLIYEKAIK